MDLLAEWCKLVFHVLGVQSSRRKTLGGAFCNCDFLSAFTNLLCSKLGVQFGSAYPTGTKFEDVNYFSTTIQTAIKSSIT